MDVLNCFTPNPSINYTQPRNMKKGLELCQALHSRVRKGIYYPEIWVWHCGLMMTLAGYDQSGISQVSGSGKEKVNTLNALWIGPDWNSTEETTCRQNTLFLERWNGRSWSVEKQSMKKHNTAALAAMAARGVHDINLNEGLLIIRHDVATHNAIMDSVKNDFKGKSSLHHLTPDPPLLKRDGDVYDVTDATDSDVKISGGGGVRSQWYRIARVTDRTSSSSVARRERVVTAEKLYSSGLQRTYATAELLLGVEPPEGNRNLLTEQSMFGGVDWDNRRWPKNYYLLMLIHANLNLVISKMDSQDMLDNLSECAATWDTKWGKLIIDPCKKSNASKVIQLQKILREGRDEAQRRLKLLGRHKEGDPGQFLAKFSPPTDAFIFDVTYRDLYDPPASAVSGGRVGGVHTAKRGASRRRRLRRRAPRLSRRARVKQRRW